MYCYFRDMKSLIKTIIYIGISLVATFVVIIINICAHMSINEAWAADVIGLIFILSGWLIGNRKFNKYVRDTGDYRGLMPLDRKIEIMKVRYPLFMGGLISILLGELIRLIFVLTAL